ncbi:MAG: acylneuraminate cytidylyltransferase family protein [Candidatus Omnitrophota bacterium]
MKRADIIALIPARGGSKGVPGKNIKLLGGYPLIAYSILAASLSKKIERVIVSTDSDQIADISKAFGAEVPFLRPAEISQDRSTDLELFQHAISWFKENENGAAGLLVHLRPTTPLRDAEVIDRAVALIGEKADSTSLRSAHELAEPPQKEFQLDEKGFFKGFFPGDKRPEYYNLPRQLFPKAYHANGYVDIVKRSFVEETGSLYGTAMLGFVTPVTTEVDLPEDFGYLEYQLEKYGNPIYDHLRDNYSKRVKV